MCTNLIIILIIVVLSISFLVFIAIKMRNGFGPYNIKVYGITLIVTFTSILVLSNIESSELTAVFGIFGAIAGYLFGLKDEKKNDNNKSGEK